MPGLLARIRRGEKIDHFQTVRQHKDGRLIDVSVSISPIPRGSIPALRSIMTGLSGFDATHSREWRRGRAVRSGRGPSRPGAKATIELDIQL